VVTLLLESQVPAAEAAPGAAEEPAAAPLPVGSRAEAAAA
jgi:hypothetical protein